MEGELVGCESENFMHLVFYWNGKMKLSSRCVLSNGVSYLVGYALPSGVVRENTLLCCKSIFWQKDEKCERSCRKGRKALPRADNDGNEDRAQSTKRDRRRERHAKGLLPPSVKIKARQCKTLPSQANGVENWDWMKAVICEATALDSDLVWCMDET